MKSYRKFIAENSANHSELQKEFEKIIAGFKQDYHDYITAAMNKAILAVKDELLATTYRHTFGASTFHNLSTWRKWNERPFAHLLKSIYSPGYSPESLEAARNKTYYIPPHGVPQPLYMDPNWKARVKKEADYATEMFHTGFLNKNLGKFEGIIGDKKLVELSHNINSGQLTGSMRAKCHDGSQFSVTFNIIVKQSSKGKWFNQFPTKFTSVYLSNGEQMKTPSEAKMKAEFPKDHGKPAPKKDSPPREPITKVSSGPAKGVWRKVNGKYQKVPADAAERKAHVAALRAKG